MKPGCWNRKYHLRLPDHIADWDATSGWEWERFASIEATLERDDVLYDIGTEHGAITAVYAQWCATTVLCEPTPEFWGNIRLTWEENHLPMPAACWAGLVGRDSVGEGGLTMDGWPQSSQVGEVGAGGYRYLHEPSHVAELPRISIDDLAYRTRVIPTAITIDVEGAEVAVLAGARYTLRAHRPIVWCSVHPDLMERDYGTTPGDLFDLMADAGYHAVHLGTDHEEHFAFSPKDGRQIAVVEVVRP
jgi:FkbM family methyltransferase